MKSAFAIGAHPDDIEFTMAGTLLLLKKAGYEIHYMTVANGSCGTEQYGYDAIVRMRREEAMEAAAEAGAVFHESLVDDLQVYYEPKTLARLSSIMREVSPEIVLTHHPFDYMEDHTNTCRLAAMAAFTRGMPNFKTEPPREAIKCETAVYHAIPHGLHDQLKRQVVPEIFVDIAEAISLKEEMLRKHRSQKEWLDVSQGMDSYLNAMRELCARVGGLSGKFALAEGWIQRLHLGLAAEQSFDPLSAALGSQAFKRRGGEQ